MRKYKKFLSYKFFWESIRNFIRNSFCFIFGVGVGKCTKQLCISLRPSLILERVLNMPELLNLQKYFFSKITDQEISERWGAALLYVISNFLGHWQHNSSVFLEHSNTPVNKGNERLFITFNVWTERVRSLHVVFCVCWSALCYW